MSVAVRDGYKQTEVGVIPEDWDVASLQKACAETITYGIVQCGPHIGNGVPYIRVSDMSGPLLDVDGMLRTSHAIASQFSRSQVKEGDVVYALRGKIGEVRTVDQSVAGANLTQGTARLSPSSRVDSTYLLYCLRSERALRQGELAAKGSTFREITLEALRQIQLPVAPIPEQRAIATALSDVDALLAKLDALIAKRRDLKVATMQQLLTGQTRLPGFSGEWEVKRLGDVAEIVMGQSPSSANYNTKGLGLPLIQGNADVIDRKTIQRIFTTEITKRGKCGDILMSVRAPVGEISRAGFDVCLGRGVCAIRYKGDFLYHYLIGIEATWARISKGSTFDSVNSAEVKALEVCLPPDYAEQTAIATILSDMDAELTALEARRDKTRALKQGMMQELLTGKIRLI